MIRMGVKPFSSQIWFFSWSTTEQEFDDNCNAKEDSPVSITGDEIATFMTRQAVNFLVMKHWQQ